jgi:hypothetical protein
MKNVIDVNGVKITIESEMVPTMWTEPGCVDLRMRGCYIAPQTQPDQNQQLWQAQEEMRQAWGREQYMQRQMQMLSGQLAIVTRSYESASADANRYKQELSKLRGDISTVDAVLQALSVIGVDNVHLAFVTFVLKARCEHQINIVPSAVMILSDGEHFVRIDEDGSIAYVHERSLNYAEVVSCIGRRYYVVDTKRFMATPIMPVKPGRDRRKGRIHVNGIEYDSVDQAVRSTGDSKVAIVRLANDENCATVWWLPSN